MTHLDRLPPWLYDVLEWARWSAIWFLLQAGFVVGVIALWCVGALAWSLVDGGWAYYDFAQITNEVVMNDNLKVTLDVCGGISVALGLWSVFQD